MTGQTTSGRIEIEGTGSDGRISDGTGVGVGVGVGAGVGSGVGVGVAGGRLGAGVGVGRAVARGVAGATVARGAGVGLLVAGDVPAPGAAAPGPDDPADPPDGAPEAAIVPLGTTPDVDGPADTATGGTATASSTTGPAGAGTIALNATATATVMSSPKPTPTAVSRYRGSMARMGHLPGTLARGASRSGDGPSRGYARALGPGSALDYPCGA
jgi:hypothetical protein